MGCFQDLRHESSDSILDELRRVLLLQQSANAFQMHSPVELLQASIRPRAAQGKDGLGVNAGCISSPYHR